MSEIKLDKIIPGLWELDHEINGAYSGIHFLWNRGYYDESEEYRLKWEELKKKREQLLKPIFGI